MFSISISFGPVGTVWGLLFKTEESAKKVYDLILDTLVSPRANNTVGACDDFGQTFIGTASYIHGVLLEDLQQSALAHQARMLHDARIKASTQKAAQTDPQLRAVVAPQGPGIVTPFGTGMAR